MIRRFAAITGLVVLSTLGISTTARASQGGIAGSAAFTIDGGNVTGVAVSAAVGKEFAAAHSFNYDGSNANGLQNSAFAIGTAGAVSLSGLGDPAGFTLDTVEDSARGTAQANEFTTGYTIQIGTIGGNSLVTVP
ncbi:hypothetical protein [Arthrospira platensis]|uniref:Uncharacterized protein n=1 Tax=Limnospira platensis NIES-46 TaxID=1236695 RepID=A0A5M3T4T4_LIMPL|nr:hypothetical protein [Arthrospira platensis]AMW27734.1 hypothetical protein AP285_06850 [Arthrospira platensis YZ]KDR58914.1 hypothetical protein APPUASWS_002390 [Arthrospira platensis str. Paraca]MBD2669434.1 hypothetical protein [Arthrospira platensis FACHB-439]MBD2710167.1 hypothetical protein [Arthrospira platensis FACHB-835]MDF2210620.1 hypothetical protein [Arthrospira platensis NCB002]MDT9183145.1 hypothetical protein [Limnospira sp. PMC 289.06]MDT9294997.1 hypothetical protein [Ar